MKQHLVEKNISISEALKKISKNGEKFLIVVDKNKKLIGTLTDGDLRRVIVKGCKLSNTINNIYNKRPKYLTVNKFDNDKVKKTFLSKQIDFIPILDNYKKIVQIITWQSIFKKNNRSFNNPVVIMAGGKGTRLDPFTKILPKPLIPINEKTIIEHIIDRFLKFSASNFYLSVNYKSLILKAFFNEIKNNYTIEFIDEKKPLGTAGSLSFIKKFKKPVFVTNCDILLKANYYDILESHTKSKNDITLVVSTKELLLPYGSCKLTKNGDLLSIIEKPRYNFLVNTGFYVINPNVTKLISKEKYLDFNDFIDIAKQKKKKIGVFPVDEESWLDFGQWSEFNNSSKILS